MSPCVSVIIPVYNAEAYLPEAIDSLINQSLKDIEVICVDDGSTDSSFSILNQYAKLEKRIKIIKQENQYAGVARNTGLLQAKGKYVIFLDADDFFEHTLLEETYLSGEKYSSDIILFTASCYDTKTKQISKAPWLLKMDRLPNSTVFSALDAANHIFDMVTPCPWTKMFKRSFVIQHGLKFQEFHNSNDIYFVLTALSLANKISVINKSLLYYRISQSSNLQANKQNEPLAFFHAYKTTLDTLKKMTTFHLFEQSFCNTTLAGCLHNLRTAKNKDTYKLIFSALNQYIFKDLSILNRDENFFYSKNDYKEFLQINYSIDNKNYLNSNIFSASPALSIIIPVYNTEKYLSECLDSINQQTFKNIEVICIDDGSIDNSIIILNRYAKNHNWLKIYHCKNNGAAHARNFAIQIASGEYIAFMDSDDFYPSDEILEMLYYSAKNSNALICGGSFSRLEKDSILYDYYGDYEKYIFHKEGFINYIDYQFDYGFTRFIYLRKLLIDNSIQFPNLSTFEDPPFFVKAMIAAGKFYAIPLVTYCYRKNIKQPVWTSKKIVDLLTGLNENLHISSKNKLAELHKLTIKHLEDDFNKIILKNILSGNPESLYLLLKSNIEVSLPLVYNSTENTKSHFFIKGIWSLIFKDNLKEQYYKTYTCHKFYSINRFITFIPRKSYSLIKYYKKYGSTKTLLKIKEKIITFFKS